MKLDVYYAVGAVFSNVVSLLAYECKNYFFSPEIIHTQLIMKLFLSNPLQYRKKINQTHTQPVSAQ